MAALLAKGEAAVCRKIGEEAVEVVTAALGGEGDRRVVEEVADLWFHTLVLLGERSIPLRDVLEELARRHAARPAPAAEHRARRRVRRGAGRRPRGRAACAGPRIENGVYHARSGYRVTLPRDGWVVERDSTPIWSCGTSRRSAGDAGQRARATGRVVDRPARCAGAPAWCSGSRDRVVLETARRAGERPRGDAHGDGRTDATAGTVACGSRATW